MGKAIRSIVVLAALAAPAFAQIDPERRRILHLGYDRGVTGAGPTGAYLFFYSNQPDFIRKGINVRLALAPVYVDGELGVRGAITEHTDMALGLAGGGFADSYSEVRGGQYRKEESFLGHGASLNGSVYHLFNPGQMIPLSGVARLGGKVSLFERRADTRPDFELPKDRLEGIFRLGFRLGGEPPELLPPRAAEFSLWYEGRARTDTGDYGVRGDRAMQPYTAQLWTRLKGIYRTRAGQRYELLIMAGATGAVDRFSAYRLGGQLPLGSEFPLSLPGYYNGELSARRYALFSGSLGIPLDPKKITSLRVMAASANVAFAPGLGQPRPWNSSLGSSLSVEMPKGTWRLELAYGYGIDAMRAGSRGAHNVTLLTQLNFDAMKGRKARRPAPGDGLDPFFQLFRP